MDGYLSNKPDNFLDDLEKLYRLRRRKAQQAKKLDSVDSKSEDEGSLESLKNSPPQSPRENRLTPMGDQPQERKIGELCTPDIVDLRILNLTEIGRSFEIKTSTIRMVKHSPFTGKEDPNLHLQAFIQHGWGDSRSNEGEALPVLATREGFAMVPLSAGGDSTKLECVDEGLLTVYIHGKVLVNLQADKSPVVVKGPFFPRVVNPRYQICGTMCNARSNIISGKHFDLEKGFCI
jgi:hypothetical protein